METYEYTPPAKEPPKKDNLEKLDKLFKEEKVEHVPAEDRELNKLEMKSKPPAIISKSPRTELREHLEHMKNEDRSRACEVYDDHPRRDIFPSVLTFVVGLIMTIVFIELLWPSISTAAINVTASQDTSSVISTVMASMSPVFVLIFPLVIIIAMINFWF